MATGVGGDIGVATDADRATLPAAVAARVLWVVRGTIKPLILTGVSGYTEVKVLWLVVVGTSGRVARVAEMPVTAPKPTTAVRQSPEDCRG